MHAFIRHHPSGKSQAPTIETRGLILKGGWRYDLTTWAHDLVDGTRFTHDDRYCAFMTFPSLYLHQRGRLRCASVQVT